MRKLIILSLIIPLIAESQVYQQGVSVNLVPGTNFMVSGELSIQSGVFRVSQGATLYMGNNSSIRVGNSGSIDFSGTSEANAMITSPGYYEFSILEGGTLSANNTIFEKMNSEGVNITPGALVNPDRAFKHSIFREGTNGGVLLTLNNEQDLLVEGAVFEENTWSGFANVKKEYNSGHVSFISFSGGFGGDVFEFDPFGLIDWHLTPVTHSISLQAGWSGLSSYIMPTETDLTTLFAPVAANLTILQNLSGIYYPESGINTIGNWLSQSAYLIKMEEATTLPFAGLPEHNKILNLSAGWNLIPVISNVEVGTSAIFDGLGSNLQIVKEAAGNKVYWPEFGITTLEHLSPGKSYFVRVNSPASVTFPNNIDGDYPAPDKPEMDAVTPWNTVIRTASSHVIGIEADALKILDEGDIIGVFTPEGLCVGISLIDNISGNFSVTAFADDNFTSVKDGFAQEDEMLFKIYHSATGEEWPANAIFDENLPNHDATFASEGISVVKELKLETTGISKNYPQLSVFPNPTTGLITIKGISGIENVRVFNAIGKLEMDVQVNGQPVILLDLSPLTSGIYQIWLNLEKETTYRRVIKK